MLDPRRLHVSRRLRQTLRRMHFNVAVDSDFGAVMRGCTAPRSPDGGTWITPAMIRAYEHLHRLGHAHSIEVRNDSRLVGGLYGVALGTAFFAESMFSRERDASKFALAALCAQLEAIPQSLIDCQVPSAHLLGLGAELVSRAEFMARLEPALAVAGPYDAGS